MDLITVIIPTYNRFNYLLNAIESVKNQTYKNIEIIVINDGSTQKEYYQHNFEDIKIIHLEKNTKELFGFPCVGYVINIGLYNASGKYIAFLDDDDYFFPTKLELQIAAMKRTGCKMSCTDGFIGKGMYNKMNTYPKFNAEKFYNILRDIYRQHRSKLLDNGFPEIWTLEFIKIHNCIIASTVLLDREIIETIGPQREIKMGGAMIDGVMVHIDYDYWLNAMKHTDCVYINEPCIYYDDSHGGGQQWN